MKRKKLFVVLAGVLTFVLATKGQFQINTEQTKHLLGQTLFLNTKETADLSGTLLRMGSVIFAMEQKQPPPDKPVPAATQQIQLSLRNQTSYEINQDSFLQKPLPFLPLKKEAKPQVLIVHTHTSEGYAPLERTDQQKKNVVQMGTLISDYLEKQGIEVVHDKTVHDKDYNGSYSRCMETVQNQLRKNPTIQIVLDVHRDAATSDDGQSLRVVTQINGKETGQIMLVVGTDEGGLSHPDWESNLSLALRVQQAMDQQSPGLSRPVNIRKERFNQHLSPGMLLVEVAASGNSLEEAEQGAKLFSKALCTVLQ